MVSRDVDICSDYCHLALSSYTTKLPDMQAHSYSKGEYEICTDKVRMDLALIHDFLSTQTNWAKGIPVERVKTSIENSLNFGVFHEGRQIGYARVITDYASIAYLGDVFILPAYRGRGLSKWLMEVIMAYPGLQGLRRWILLTSDAGGLYAKYGWKKLPKPELYMEIHDPDVYKASQL